MNRLRIGLIGVAVLAALGLLYSAIWERPIGPTAATFDQPANSPSGKYRLVVVRGYDGNSHFASFQVTTNEQHPRVLYCDRWHFRTFNTTYFLWGAGDRVWVYSGDLGTFFWTSSGASNWTMHSYSGERAPVPETLRKLYPTKYGGSGS